MALRIYGQKLPPLLTKPNLVPCEFSEDDKAFYAEDNEDAPLLSKNVSERKTSDIISTTKIANIVSSTSQRQSSGDRNKLHYSSTEDTNRSSCLKLSRNISPRSTDIVDSFLKAASPSVEKVDGRYDEIKLLDNGDILPSYESDKATIITPDAFESCISNKVQEDVPKLGTMFRSLSSNENYKDIYVYDDQKPQFHERVQRRFKLNHKRPAISRSQSQSLATEEDEYSKYWRGEVTVIEMRGTELPNLKSEQTLDDKMAGSAITRSILMGNNRLSLECLKQGENPHLTCTKTGRSYLHIIAITATIDHQTKWVPMIYQFSNFGVGIDRKDVEGQTAVRLAIRRRAVQVLAALLKCGAEFTAADEYHAEQITGVVKSEVMEVIRRLTPSYWSAIDNFTHFKINRLVKAWSRVNISKKGQTLIEYAKQNSRDMVVVKLLVQNEASIELAHAVMAGDAERVRVILCDSAADLTTCDTSVRNNMSPLTLLEAAVKYDHQDVLKVLKEASKLKPSIFWKPDPYTDFNRTHSGDNNRSSLYIHEKIEAPSTSLHSSVVYYGSGNNVGDTGSVTSTMCTIL